MRPIALAGVLVSIGACTGGGGGRGRAADCICDAAVEEGRLVAECGVSACVNGAGYRCTGPNTAVRDPAACGAPTNPRPADAPDLVILSVSGHCFDLSCPVDYHPEYLSMAGTTAAIAQVFESRGLTTATGAFGDSLYSWEVDGTLVLSGFLDLVSTMEALRDEWIADYDNPTRVVVVGHSHGTVWAHTALFVLERSGAPLPVDVLVDLDGIALGWENDVATAFVGDTWAAEIRQYNAETGMSWPFDISDAADSWAVAGVAELQDIEDVVPESVVVNLEVWSASTVVSDRDLNHRESGSTEQLAGVMSTLEHEDVDAPSSDAMRWVIETIELAYGF